MKPKKIFKQMNNIFLLTLFLLLTIIVIFQNIDFLKKDMMVFITFLFIGIYSIYNIVIRNKYSYSLDGFHWIFIYLFCFVAPIYQSSSGSFPWNLSIDIKLILYGNVLVIIWMLIYNLSYSYGKRIKYSLKGITIRKNDYLFDKIVILISIVSAFFLIHKIGLNNMFNRSISNSIINQTSSKGIMLIITNFVRAIPVACFAFTFLKEKNIKSGRKRYLLISLIICITTNFPTGTSRFWTGIVYIGIAILIFNKYFSMIKLIEYFILFGLIVIFPFINIFRYITIDEFTIERLTKIKWFDFSIFLSGDFDAYSMFLRTIMYVKKYGITYFNQLLGVILFFIPRSFWNSKPNGSGELVAQAQFLLYDNLSNPIFSEGYINFGIIGVIIFGIILGTLLGALDKRYWTNKSEVTLIAAVYPFLLGNLFSNLRGALLATFAYTVGQILAFVFIYVVLKITYKLRIVLKK